MCGRFTLTDPVEALVRLFSAAPGNDLPPVPRYNICPTQTVVAVISQPTDSGPQRRLTAMRWGFVPQWYDSPTDGPLIINARSDTVATKPAFRAAIRTRRCLIPASGFYEWSQGPGDSRLPWYIRNADGTPLAIAGLWQDWTRGDQTLTCCAMLTVDAGPAMAGIHHREPLTLTPDDWPLWLGEAGLGAARLMQAAPPGRLIAHRVATTVNSNRASGPELIEPVSG